MKAYRLHSYGDPSCIQLDDIPIPSPSPTQALIAISTVGMNPIDWKIREGYVRDFRHFVLPTTLGVDFCGTVVALGADVSLTSSLRVGDRVTSMSTSLGAFAEYIVVEAESLARVPAGLSDITAVTLPIPAGTAWQSLNTAGEVKMDMRVLVHGASGIVGAFAMQFAKALGAWVIGTASAKNQGYVMGLGADEFIDYQTESFEDRAKNIDLVLDYVLLGGAKNTIDRSWGVLKPNGTIVSVADPTILGKIPAGFRGFFPQIQPDASRLEAIAERLANGKISSKVAEVLTRGDLVKAMEINKSGGTTGKLVVDFKRA